ncbi:MAG: hypothetical protein ACE15F_04430 [bacterium]
MEKWIAFVEVPGQLAAVPEEYSLVALTPGVELVLDQEKRVYTRPEDYIAPLADERWGLENYTRVEAFCARLDEILAKRVEAVAEGPLRPASWSLFFIKQVFDLFAIRALELQSLLKLEKPERILYFEREKPGPDTEWLHPRESAFAAVLDVLAPPLSIAAERREAVVEPPPPSSRKRFTITRLGDSLRYRWKQALRLVRRPVPTEVVCRALCLDYGYSLPWILEELEKRRGDFWVWREDGVITRGAGAPAMRLDPARDFPEERTEELLRAIASDSRTRELAVVEDIDLWSLLEPRLRMWIRRSIPRILQDYKNALRIIRELRPDVVLTSMGHAPRQKAICWAARQRGIPPVIARHGEQFMRAYPRFANGDPETADWFLCWGRWEEKWLYRYKRREIHPLIVGAPMIEEGAKQAPSRARARRKAGLPMRGKTALYVPTLFSGNEFYMGDRQTNDSDYFRDGKKIIQALLGMKGWRVAVKEHPNQWDSIWEAWRQTLPEARRVTVIRTLRFIDCLYLADVVVLDAPSTTLVQSLLGRGHVYIADHPIYQWEPGVLDYFHKHGITVCRVDELSERLRRDEQAGKFIRPADYRGCLEPLLYKGKQGGGAAVRAATALLDIAAKADPIYWAASALDPRRDEAV